MSFKFNFEFNEDEANISVLEPVFKNLVLDDSKTHFAPPLIPTQEFFISDIEPTPIEVEPIEIKAVDTSSNNNCIIYKRLLSSVKLQLAQEDNLIKENNSVDTIKSWIEGLDVVNHVYEGGFKTWESAIDLSSYLLVQSPDLFLRKNVIELGCGSAIPSLTILKRFQPRSLHFSDYNKEVIRLATIPNVLANVSTTPVTVDENSSELEIDIETNDILKASSDKFRFFFGDWGNLPQIVNDGTGVYDVLLTTETLYTPELIPKIYNVILKLLVKPHGVAFVASKTVYFGCGGGTLQFKDIVESDNQLTCEVGWSIKTGIAREILILKWK